MVPAKVGRLQELSTQCKQNKPKRPNSAPTSHPKKYKNANKQGTRKGGAKE